ncbi:MAG: FtsW/RodA/SpoVE family cell cycle protein [Clostridia bacterium]|nr:FtsW/RodA/SpoVE family cell cycle protein [Clostridia bacterium]
MQDSRRQEALLLVPVAVLLLAGSSLYYALAPLPENRFLFVGAVLLACLYYVLHFLLVLQAKGADQLLLPITAMLTSLGLIFLYHLDPNLAVKQWFWTVLGLVAMAFIILAVRDYHWLAEFKYTFILLGLAFLVLTVLIGDETGGARSWLSLGQFRFQPAEVVKLLVIIFMAAYLSEYKESIIGYGDSKNPFRLDLQGFGPLLVVGGLLIVLLVVQKDLGAALIFFGLILSMVYVASGRVWLVVLGLWAFGAASLLAYYLFPHVQTRVAIWYNPWPLADGPGYQIVQTFFSLAQGGILGMGVGMSNPRFIPAAATDFIFAVAGGELGFLGASLILFLYAVIGWRGLGAAASAPDDFGLLLAGGLAMLFSLQTLVIIGGILKLLPLTGVTLPLMSYGGSSLVINYLMLGLLIRLTALFASPEGTAVHED